MTARKTPPPGGFRRNRPCGDTLARFEERIQRVANGCWEWTGTLLNTGYGQFVIGGRRGGIGDLAHRFAWLFFRGALPLGAEIHHRCENRRCVNPEHLDALSKKVHAARHPTGQKTGARNRAKTHCPAGHPIDGLLKSGERYCKTCARRRARDHYWRSHHANS